MSSIARSFVRRCELARAQQLTLKSSEAAISNDSGSSSHRMFGVSSLQIEAQRSVNTARLPTLPLYILLFEIQCFFAANACTQACPVSPFFFFFFERKGKKSSTENDVVAALHVWLARPLRFARQKQLRLQVGARRGLSRLVPDNSRVEKCTVG